MVFKKNPQLNHKKISTHICSCKYQCACDREIKGVRERDRGRDRMAPGREDRTRNGTGQVSVLEPVTLPAFPQVPEAVKTRLRGLERKCSRQPGGSLGRTETSVA